MKEQFAIRRLCKVMELYSRRVIGWSIQRNLQRRLVIDALRMAIGKRASVRGVIFHSDRGSQYSPAEFRRLLARSKMIASMSANGICWDNARVESFFSTLKTEALIHPSMSQAAIRREVVEYIEVFYNRQRIHSTLNGMAPAIFEHLSSQSTKLCA